MRISIIRDILVLFVVLIFIFGQKLYHLLIFIAICFFLLDIVSYRISKDKKLFLFLFYYIAVIDFCYGDFDLETMLSLIVFPSFIKTLFNYKRVNIHIIRLIQLPLILIVCTYLYFIATSGFSYSYADLAREALSVFRLLFSFDMK